MGNEGEARSHYPRPLWVPGGWEVVGERLVPQGAATGERQTDRYAMQRKWVFI